MFFVRTTVIVVLSVFPLNVSAYEPKIVGQAFLTASQKAQLQDRKARESGLYISTEQGFFGDWNFIKNRAEVFRADSRTSTGDSGRWANFSSENGEIGTIAPTNVISPVPLSVNDNIHYAALVAHLDDDIELAQAVFKELVIVANDDQLDASNGTTKHNATFGTTIRFNYEYRSSGPPWFASAAKIQKYIESYALVYPIVKNDPFFQGNVERVEQFFEDWHNYMKQISDNLLRGFVGDNWRQGLYEQDTILEPADASFSQPFTHLDENNQPVNRTTILQNGAFNNRVWDFIGLVSSYGVYFNNADSRNFTWSYFKLFLELNVFPDGTLSEWYRSYDGSPNQGFVYNYATLLHIIRVAQKHAVAVENGLPGVQDRGKYYDYTTSIGSEEKSDNYPGDSTSGGQKGILTMLINLSRYHRSPEDGGYIGLRKSETLASYDGDRYVWSIVPAIANTYYQRQELTDYMKFDISKGYPGPDSTRGNAGASSWGPWGEHSWGASGTGYGIGVYADLDSIFSFPEEQICVPVSTKNGKVAMICL